MHRVARESERERLREEIETFTERARERESEFRERVTEIERLGLWSEICSEISYSRYPKSLFEPEASKQEGMNPISRVALI